MKAIKTILGAILLAGCSLNVFADAFNYKICIRVPGAYANKLPQRFDFKILGLDGYVLEQGQREDSITITAANAVYCTNDFRWETEGASCGSHSIAQADGAVSFFVFKKGAQISGRQFVKTSTSAEQLNISNPIIYVEGDLFKDPGTYIKFYETLNNNIKFGAFGAWWGTPNTYTGIAMQTVTNTWSPHGVRYKCNPYWNETIVLTLNDKWFK
jgi:hypothetical protein